LPENENNDKVYYLEFDESEEIMKMQQYYKNYDELLKDIVYVNEEVNIAERLVFLNYVKYIFNPISNIKFIKKRLNRRDEYLFLIYIELIII